MVKKIGGKKYIFSNKIFIYLLAIIFILSAILKMLYPDQIISTIKIMIKNIFHFEPSLFILIILLIIVTLVETLIGLSILFGINTKKLMLAAFVATVFFTLISQYLNSIGRLESCGCFGTLSSAIYPYHLVFLYIYNILFIFYFAFDFFSSHLRKKEKPN